MSDYKYGDYVVALLKYPVTAVFKVTEVHKEYVESGSFQLNKSEIREAYPEEVERGYRWDESESKCIYDKDMKIESLKNQLIRIGYTDNGGELMRPPLGKPPRFDLYDDLKNSLNELAQKYRTEAHELSLIRDFEKSQMYSHFARELDHLIKGGA